MRGRKRLAPDHPASGSELESNPVAVHLSLYCWLASFARTQVPTGPGCTQMPGCGSEPQRMGPSPLWLHAGHRTLSSLGLLTPKQEPVLISEPPAHSVDASWERTDLRGSLQATEGEKENSNPVGMSREGRAADVCGCVTPALWARASVPPSFLVASGLGPITSLQSLLFTSPSVW